MSTLSRWFHVLSDPIPELDDMVPSRFPELYLFRPCRSYCTRAEPEPSARICAPRQRKAQQSAVQPLQQVHMVGYEGMADQVEVTPDGLKFHALETWHINLAIS
eukprot:s6114_g2.t1